MTAVQLSIVFVPIALYGAVKRSKEIFRLSVISLVLVFAQSAILFMASFDALSTLQYNWLQKFIVFICAILLCKPLGVTPKECGFFLPSSRTALLFAFLVGTVYAGIDILGIEEHKIPTIETVLFQLTMPGLQEEPFYRGLLLSLWDKHFGRPIKVLGVNFGLGSVITTAIFTVVHLVFLDENWKLAVNPNILEWINFIVFSFIMCWLRYKFESVWPCVLAHNFDNGFVKLFSWFVSTHPRS